MASTTRRRATKPAAETTDQLPAAEAVIDVSAIVPTTSEAEAEADADPEVSVLSRWDALAADIAIASQNAEGKTFDYRDRWGNKEARSLVASLRRLKGRIERCRKDAKAVYLERGRAVDATAKLLEASVQGLIEPHELALQALEAEEEARIAAHRAVLDRIAELAQSAVTAADAEARLAELATIDSTVLEEFATAGANRLADAIDGMEEQLAALRQREAEQAELEQLRAEKAAREEAERLEAIRQEAIEAERQRAAAEQEAERQRLAEQARQAEQAAAQREAEAAAAAEAALLAQQEAERRAAEAERQAAEARAREEARQQAEAAAAGQREAEQAAAAEAARLAAEALKRTRLARVEAFRDQLVWSVATLSSPAEVIDLLVDGQLHPAICIDWDAV